MRNASSRLARRLAAAGAAIVLAGATLVAPGTAQAAVSHADLALRWAPIHYQDVDVTGAHALAGRSDYLTRVDYDGNLVGRDNWDHAGQAGVSFAAHVYYSVVETSTHWYLTYLFFHPRDWVDHPFFETEHENDAEGRCSPSNGTDQRTGCCARRSPSRTPTSTPTRRPAAPGPPAGRPWTGRCSSSPPRTTPSPTRSPRRRPRGTA
ncbi:hypothetical protein [Plantactinospora sp. KBS50]|uniref:hypothetical protein n=1 Tax=Plantactinospora sp. KBS50 TaxID=2024580 RepID=UPI001E2B2D51|nr:hypothetical protein [Plantactinospora sp. KBS50]